VDDPLDKGNPILHRPKPTPGVEKYYRAFQELSTDRPPSFSGISPIPWSSIDRYARRHGIEDEDFDVLVRMIRAADAALMKILRARSPEK